MVFLSDGNSHDMKMYVRKNHFQVCLGFTVSSYSPRLTLCPWRSNLKLLMSQMMVLLVPDFLKRTLLKCWPSSTPSMTNVFIFPF